MNDECPNDECEHRTWKELNVQHSTLNVQRRIEEILNTEREESRFVGKHRKS